MSVAASAMAAVASSQAAVAATAAHQVHVANCKAFMPNFNPKEATIAEMREYSACVDAMYPMELGPEVIFAVKVALFIALGAGLAGGWRHARRHSWDGDAVVIGVLCAFIALLGLLAVFSIWWLFTAAH